MDKRLLFLFISISAGLASPLLQRKSFNDDRVIGGYPAQVGARPYQVSLRNSGDFSHSCGGSVISPNFVLTAAHCTYTKFPRTIKVVVGTNYLEKGGTTYDVNQIIVHPQWIPQISANDISLLRITKQITYTSLVQPVLLAQKPFPPGWWCQLTGWGTTAFPNTNQPNALQEIQLLTITTESCKAKLQGYPVSDTNVCTQNGPGEGGCFGDSGGPLVCGSEQFGIVSWGISCAWGAPDVFTGVPFYREWIYSVAGV